MKEMLKAWYAREKEKTAEMTKEQKINYIAEYYGVFIVGGIIVLIILAWLFYHFVLDHKEEGFNCAIVNCEVEADCLKLSDDLTEYFGYNPKKINAYLDADYQIEYPGVANEAADNSLYEKFFLNIRMKRLDAVLMPKSYMEYCNTVGHPFYDVSEVLSEEQMKQYEPYFIKGKDDEGEEYICGIDVSHMKFLDSMGITALKADEDDCVVLSFAYGGQHLDESRAFLTYLEQFETEQ